jgi:hypothetical protein
VGFAPRPAAGRRLFRSDDSKLPPRRSHGAGKESQAWWSATGNDGFAPWRGNRKRILRRIVAGVAALVALAAPWTCLSAPAPSPPQAAADPAQALPAAPAVQAPPVTTKKTGNSAQRARNAAHASAALSAPNPDFRREPPNRIAATGGPQPASRSGALG